jgi:hypothetical protein
MHAPMPGARQNLSDYTASRSVPRGAMKVQDKASSAVAYLYERDGRLYAVAFHGKAGKADWHFRFKTAEQRAAKIGEHFANVRASDKRKADEAAERKASAAKGQGLEVGHILVCSWGYEQTNIDFYQVTALIGKTMLELRKIGSCDASRAGGPSMTGHVVPNPDVFTGEPLRRKVRRYGKSVSVSITDYSSAELWDGRPRWYSTYA